MHMLCKGSRLQPKAGSQRIATTAQQQDLIQRNDNQFVATGILSTWELPTHLQYTIPDANNQLHLLLLTHEMWELPTPLIVANKPSRENEVRELPAQPPRYTGTTRSSLNIESWYSQFNRTGIARKTGLDSNMRVFNAAADTITQAQDRNLTLMTTVYTREMSSHTSPASSKRAADTITQAQIATMTHIHHPKTLGSKSDAYDNSLHKGDVFAHLTSFKQTFENTIQTKRLSKRSPTLPLSPSSELSTVGNRRR
ncbi:laccase-14-like [Dorcoceras hygrometricum]|uniref:Laccase-14-like n=1 Tax=Dorcoceras hygrometricum TaxID=472368 RepID=A0A2Z7CQZ6_9LAMI|nr:laccase-14-like [Dorcoceras hygrometricum]